MSASEAIHSASPAKTPRRAKDLEAGRRVLTTEADSLAVLAGALDDTFVAAVDLLDGVTGRVICTGMGKSGHIATKIAATLASTGTPAQFVHPGEAAHGDLGMIVPGDAIIALSNSGETEELACMIMHAKRFQIPLIGMTGRAGSALSDAADVPLVLPRVVEACPHGLAPTTSTTLMLALGDALAVALLERKGFSADDFRILHPGGKLGRLLLKVSDIMHHGSEVPLVPPDMPMSDALLVMTAKRFGCLGIVSEQGDLLGILTDGDLRRHMSEDLLKHSAGDVMTEAPQTIRPAALASEAVQIMNARSITNLFVVEDGKPVGILHIHDCLRAGVA